VDPTIPSELSDIVERMLRKNPDHRYQNLEDLRADLDGARERFAGDHTRGFARTFAKDVPDQARRLDSRHFGVGEGREAAEHAREAVARARRSAGRTGSIKLAPDQWMKAAQLEAQANAALDRDDFAAAQSLFMEACALYEQCAQFATRGSAEGSMDVGPSRRPPGRSSATPLPGVPSRRQRHGDETVLEPDRPDTEASPRTRDGLGDGPFAFDPTVLAEMSGRGHDDTGSLSTEAGSPVAAARSASPRKRRLVAAGVGAAGLGILLGVGYVVHGFIRDVRPATPPQARAPYPSALPGPPSPSESTDSSKGETSSLPAVVPSPQPSPPAASGATEPLPTAGQASVEPLVTEPPRELPPRSPELPKRPPEQLAAVPQPLPRPPVIVTPRRDPAPPPAPETVVPLAEPPAPLASLPSGAPLDQTVGWLKKALSTHSKVKTRASQVMYETRGLDGCMIDWRATLPSGRQLTVKAAIHYADGGRTKVTQEDGGWVVSLPWSDGHTVTHGDETFSGFLVWFSSADAAAKAESAFKRAIALCSEEPVAAK
jgi:hypothetical protein